MDNPEPRQDEGILDPGQRRDRGQVRGRRDTVQALGQFPPRTTKGIPRHERQSPTLPKSVGPLGLSPKHEPAPLSPQVSRASRVTPRHEPQEATLLQRPRRLTSRRQVPPPSATSWAHQPQASSPSTSDLVGSSAAGKFPLHQRPRRLISRGQVPPKDHAPSQ